jgi:uncharacterized protein (DUF2141 family)
VRRGTRFGACVATVVAVGCGGAGVTPGGSAGGVGPVDGVPAFNVSDPLEREVAPFPVTGPEGSEYPHPFLGGFEVPRPQFGDIDADGDLDFFVQKYSGSLMFFENVGTPRAAEYEWRTSRWQGLEIGEWARLHDADGDGDLDLFHELPSSYMRYVENVGTPEEPRLETVQDSVRVADGRALFSDAQNIPFFQDVDCDGATDVFLGRIDGTVSRYEFAGFEGRVPTFELVADRFENIEIVAEFAVSGDVPEAPGPSLHGANSMAFADWDGDGDPDLFWGDFFEAGLLLIENIGTCERPDLDVEPELIPADEQVTTSGYNAAALPDIDGDGNIDLVMGVLGGAFNANRTSAENLHFYRGTDANTFEFVTTRYLDQIDIGSDAVPAFGDLDGDGDLDMLLGSRLDPETAEAPPLYHFENVGSRTAPEFVFVGMLEDVAYTNSSPELADLDGDGDQDILLGTFNRDVRWFRNDGTASSPSFVSASEDPIADLPRGSYSTPTVGDLDGDGDLDLIVGESSGELNLFENVGSATDPRFELVTERISEIDAGVRSVPTLVDVDGDGDLDLVVGDESRGLSVFRNVGSPQAADFEPEGTALGDFTSRLSQPRFVDLDGDGDLDLVVGDQGGGLHFYRNGAR